jgi:hypothetical protein
VSKKHTQTPGDAEHPSIIQPIIDDLKENAPPELPIDDQAAPPRGPLHPPQPDSDADSDSD